MYECIYRFDLIMQRRLPVHSSWYLLLHYVLCRKCTFWNNWAGEIMTGKIQALASIQACMCILWSKSTNLRVNPRVTDALEAKIREHNARRIRLAWHLKRTHRPTIAHHYITPMEMPGLKAQWSTLQRFLQRPIGRALVSNHSGFWICWWPLNSKPCALTSADPQSQRKITDLLYLWFSWVQQNQLNYRLFLLCWGVHALEKSLKLSV